ncbi:hypothetical protein BJX96DRAFT_137780 [Aspergillus floccosus]
MHTVFSNTSLRRGITTPCSPAHRSSLIAPNGTYRSSDLMKPFHLSYMYFHPTRSYAMAPIVSRISPCQATDDRHCNRSKININQLLQGCLELAHVGWKIGRSENPHRVPSSPKTWAQRTTHWDHQITNISIQLPMMLRETVHASCSRLNTLPDYTGSYLSTQPGVVHRQSYFLPNSTPPMNCNSRVRIVQTFTMLSDQSSQEGLYAACQSGA